MISEKQQIIDNLHAVENKIYDVRESLAEVKVNPTNAHQLLGMYDALVKAETQLAETLDSRWWD